MGRSVYARSRSRQQAEVYQFAPFCFYLHGLEWGRYPWSISERMSGIDLDYNTSCFYSLGRSVRPEGKRLGQARQEGKRKKKKKKKKPRNQGLQPFS